MKCRKPSVMDAGATAPRGRRRAASIGLAAGQAEGRADRAAPATTSLRLADAAQSLLLRRMASACVVISRAGRVLHTEGPVEAFLAEPPGSASSDLFALAGRVLGPRLRAAVLRVVREETPRSLRGVTMRHGDRIRRIGVDIEPLKRTGRAAGLLLVAFREQPAPGLEGEAGGRRHKADERECSSGELKASTEETVPMITAPQSASGAPRSSEEAMRSLNAALSGAEPRLHDWVPELEGAGGQVASLLCFSDIPTIVLDHECRVVRFTLAAAALLGLAASDVGRAARDIARRVSDDELPTDARHVLRGLGARERDVRSADGRWYLRRIAPCRGADGRIIGVVITFVDVTRTRRASEELAQRLAAIVDHTADAVYSFRVHPSEPTILTWNAGAERLLGMGRDEAVGTSVHRVVPRGLRREWEAAVERVRRGEHVEQFESHRPRGVGAPVAVATTLSPIRGAGGAVSAVCAVARDISGSKRIEAELTESRERLQAILTTAIDAIVTIDERGLMRSVNPAAERMFGYSEAEMLGRSILMLMPPPHWGEHAGSIERCLDSGEARVIGRVRQLEARRRDGTVFPVDMAVSEVIKGKLFTGVIRDLSERLLAASRLANADRLASLGTLAAGLGHDMSNMLLPMRAHLDAAAMASHHPVVQRHLGRVRSAVDYLQELADGLHFLAADPERRDSGGTEGTDLAGWWGRSRALLSNPVPGHVRLVSSIPRALPRVAVAPHQITQAVLNLIVNAAQAIPKPSAAGGRGRRARGGTIWLSASAEPGPRGARGGSAPGAVRLKVRDDGTGMSDEVRRHAFEMFFTTKARGLGTGLGLPLVARVVERVGGSVEIESEPGKGTTVTLTLPTVPPRPRAGARRRSRAGVISVGESRVADLIRQLLQSAGVAVRGGGDPGSASLWVVDPALVEPSQVRRWRSRRPKRAGPGVLVVLGPLSGRKARSWGGLAPIVIERRDDFMCVREALRRALRF